LCKVENGESQPLRYDLLKPQLFSSCGNSQVEPHAKSSEFWTAKAAFVFEIELQPVRRASWKQSPLAQYQGIPQLFFFEATVSSSHAYQSSSPLPFRQEV
jgi:hypothetical protein